MAKTFKLELLAADRPFFVGECEHLIYPAQDGLSCRDMNLWLRL